MTKTDVSIEKFVNDIFQDTVPNELKCLQNKIKITAIADGKEMSKMLNLKYLRNFFTIKEKQLLIKNYITGKLSGIQLKIYDNNHRVKTI